MSGPRRPPARDTPPSDRTEQPGPVKKRAPARKPAAAKKAAPTKQAASGRKVGAKKPPSGKKVGAKPAPGKKVGTKTSVSGTKPVPGRKAAPAGASRRPPGAGPRRRPARKAPPVKPVHPLVARYAPTHDTQGPKVRLGLAWAAVLLLSLVVSSFRPYSLALAMAVVAAVAAGEVVDARRRDQRGPDRWVAEAGASALPLLATLGTGGLGVGLLVLVAGGAVAPFVVTETERAPFARAGLAVGAGALCGAVGASVVLLADLEVGAIVILLATVLVWDASDFVIGSGARRPWEGPVAAVIALVPVTIIFAVLRVPPFRGGDLWGFTLLTVLACPAGQVLASALLPTAETRAPALRRLDSLILTGPLWVWLVGLYL